MAKLGRPSVYQSEDEKPVTVSVRIPRDVYDRVERYVKRHPGMTLTEFFLDGARLRLDTPADPRDIILSDDNTVMQEVQEMIRAAVQAEIGTLRDFMGPHGSTPAPEGAAQPVPELSHDDNTVIQKSITQPQEARKGGRPTTIRRRIVDLLRAHPEGLTAEEIRVDLGVDRNLADVLQAMVRDQLLTKQGSGAQVRYHVARPSEPPPAPGREASATAAPSSAGRSRPGPRKRGTSSTHQGSK